MRIGITGHQQIGDDGTIAWVRNAMDRVLGEHSGPLVGVTSLAGGADQMFAELVVARAGRLEAILPFPEYRERSFHDDRSRELYDGLIARAVVDVLARDGRSDHEAYLHAGETVVARCDLLVAVWDGASAREPGGTADVVAHARECGRALVIIDCARRMLIRERAAAAQPHTALLGDVELDAVRNIGDPIVDAAVSAYVTAYGASALGTLTGALFRAPALPEDHPLVGAYLQAVSDIELGDQETIARGQQLFGLFGPEIFLVLGSCSLPLAYAAGNGVQTIYRARRLKDDAVRRLFDTAQMVVNVMQVGQLARDGIGWRSACKVRLMHALIRRQVQSDPASPWCSDWGTPINQEDMAGTLLSFSVAVLHGLKRMGARLSREDADSYIYTWSAIGRLLGVDEALLPRGEADAGQLAERIGRRQIRATVEGRLLAEQLMQAIATLFPVRGYANSLTHFFLEDTAFGENVAEVLALPKPGWSRVLVTARAWQKRKVLAMLGVVPGSGRRRSFLARRFVQRMICIRRPEGAAPFEVPDELARAWRINHPSAARRRRPDASDDALGGRNAP